MEQDRQYTYNVTWRRFSATVVAVLHVCTFVALGIQHAMGMRHIILCGLPRYTTLFRIIS